MIFLTQGIFGNVYRHLCHNFGLRAVEVALVVKNPIAKAGDIPVAFQCQKVFQHEFLS